MLLWCTFQMDKLFCLVFVVGRRLWIMSSLSSSKRAAWPKLLPEFSPWLQVAKYTRPQIVDTIAILLC